MPNPAIIPDVTELQALPYLTAFIQEGKVQQPIIFFQN
jgi:hypothetical protein